MAQANTPERHLDLAELYAKRFKMRGRIAAFAAVSAPLLFTAHKLRRTRP